MVCVASGGARLWRSAAHNHVHRQAHDVLHMLAQHRSIVVSVPHFVDDIPPLDIAEGAHRLHEWLASYIEIRLSQANYRYSH